MMQKWTKNVFTNKVCDYNCHLYHVIESYVKQHGFLDPYFFLNLVLSEILLEDTVTLFSVLITL